MNNKKKDVDLWELRGQRIGRKTGGENITVESDAPLIVLAEDDKAMRVALSSRLRADGYEVRTFKDGKELSAFLENALDPGHKATLPDLIITDIRMPGENGLSVLGRFREKEPSLPILFITAFGDLRTHGAAKKMGAVVLDKPFGIDLLQQTISDLIQPEGAQAVNRVGG